MLDVELNLVLDFLVVFVSVFDFEVYQKAEVIVEAKKVVLLALVGLEDFFNYGWLSTWSDVPRSTVKAMSIKRSEWLDVDSLFFTNNSLIVVLSTAMVAGLLTLLDGDHDIIRQAQMNK